MKNFILFAALILNINMFSTEELNSKQIETMESAKDIYISRSLQVVPLATGLFIGGILSLPIIALYKAEGPKVFKQILDSPFIIPITMEAGLLCWGTYKLIDSFLRRNVPIIKINQQGFYHESYGFISWDKVEPLVVEDLEDLRVLYRNVWLKRLDENGKYIEIDTLDLTVNLHTLLTYISKYKKIYVPTHEEFADYIPLKLQSTVTPELRSAILEGPGRFSTKSRVFYCLKDFPHQCNKEIDVCKQK